jgi:hypothetical protein
LGLPRWSNRPLFSFFYFDRCRSQLSDIITHYCCYCARFSPFLVRSLNVSRHSHPNEIRTIMYTHLLLLLCSLLYQHTPPHHVPSNTIVIAAELPRLPSFRDEAAVPLGVGPLFFSGCLLVEAAELGVNFFVLFRSSCSDQATNYGGQLNFSLWFVQL